MGIPAPKGSSIKRGIPRLGVGVGVSVARREAGTVLQPGVETPGYKYIAPTGLFYNHLPLSLTAMGCALVGFINAG